VLVSAIDTTRVNHKKAICLIEKIRRKEVQSFISTQIIGEFYVSLTRSFGDINTPLTSKEAGKEIEEMLSCFGEKHKRCKFLGCCSSSYYVRK